MTYSLIQVALALTRKPKEAHWGYELAQRTGVKAGVVYPLLGRLLKDGMLTDGWESDPHPGKPPRRYYRLTREGTVWLNSVVMAARRDARFVDLFL
jgi:PadR family transcriptional regulator PadR